MAGSPSNMSDVNMRRSQAILRMPVDYVDVTLILHDGERSEVIVFIAHGEDVVHLVGPGDPFIPVMRAAKICIVARSAIACIGIVPKVVDESEAELPTERQRASVKLRSGTVLEGELRWIQSEGRQRTADHLNAASPYFIVHTAALDYLVVKAHVATVQEI